MTNGIFALGLLIIAIFISGIFIGKLMFGIYDNEKTLTRMTGAYGFDEKSNMWNRIRVDENGNVICHKE